MAANVFHGGSTGSAELIFDRAVDHLNINVTATVSLSLDGVDFIDLPAGFHSFKIGQTKKLYVTATGDWQLLAVQS